MNNLEALSYINALLAKMIEMKASDLFISANFPPSFKIDGKMTPVANQKLTDMHTKAFAYALMTEKQRINFEQEKEANFAIWPK